MAYISFVGNILTPSSSEVLSLQYPEITVDVFEGIDSHENERYREVGKGFREGLNYTEIGGQDSLTVYLAHVVIESPFRIGHLVADCPAGGWVNETFCYLDKDGNVLKENNFNPNPVPQVI